MRGLFRAFGGFAVFLVIALGVAACGSSGSSSSGDTGSSEGGGKATIDLGTSEIEVENKTPKIGFFAYGLSAYELSYKAEIEKLNGEGHDITWIEAKFDAATQLKQLQSAITESTYDAIVIESVDAEGACRIVSEQAPDAGIPVGIIINPVCGRALNPWGEEVWTPGTLNVVSDTANVTYFTNVLERQKEALEITPDTKVGVINGPDIGAQAQSYGEGVKAAGIEPTEIVAGDYTAPTAQKLTQAMLSRNPDIEVIINGYEGATPGIIAALKEAGKGPGEIKIGDIGGSSEISVPNLESGWLTITAVYDPKEIARTAVEQMEAAFGGEQGPRFLTADPVGGTLDEPLQVTKEDVGSFKPTY